MKNPEKQFFEAERLKRQSSILVLDKECGLRKMPTNHLLYQQAERMSLEAQEEMGRQNKRKIKKELKKIEKLKKENQLP